MLGRFITIEGIDGAGKSTQTESLLKHLAAKGVPPGSRVWRTLTP